MSAMTDLGPTRITMADVARRAGVSRMTVYRRYSSLGELISAALTAEMAGVVAEVLSRAGDRRDARRRVVAQTIAVVEALCDHTLLQRVLEVDPESLLPLLVERLGSGQRLLREHLAGEVAGGMRSLGGDGSIRDADPGLLALMVLTMAQPFVVGMRPLTGEYPRPDLMTELGTALDRFLRTE